MSAKPSANRPWAAGAGLFVLFVFAPSLPSLSAAAELAPDGIASALALARAGNNRGARAAFEKIAASKTATAPEKARATMELARLDLSDGQYSAATARARDAASQFTRIGDKGGAGDSITLVGMSETYAGDYAAALTDTESALAIAKERNDPAATVTRLNNIGNILYFQGNYAGGMRRLDEAMRLLNTSPRAPWTDSRRQLTTANMAVVYQRLGLYQRALDAYADLRAKHGGLSATESAQLLTNMGSLYRRLGDPGKALETYQSAKAIYGSHGLRSGEIGVQINIGITEALDFGESTKALLAFEQALAMAKAAGARPAQLQASLYRAEALLRVGKVPQARDGFLDALALADAVKSPEDKWKVLHGLARTDLAVGDHAMAASRLEQSVGIIESLRTAGPSGLRGGFLADKRQVYDLLIEEAAGAAKPDAAAVFHWIEMSRARTVQDRLAPANLATTRHRLGDRRVVQEYWLGDSAIAMVSVSSGGAGVNFRRTPPGLRRRIAGLARLLRDPRSVDWKPAADALRAELLFDSSGVAVVVVPDRELALLPMELMMPGVPISYLPSAALLSEAQLSPAQPARRWLPFWAKSLVAVADPAGNLAPLPSARSEARNVADSVGGAATVLFGVDATKTAFQKALANPAPVVVHVAAHAVNDVEDPARSRIALSGDPMYLGEMQRLDFHGVDLVTLSACETEGGAIVEGEGVESFGRALLSAGTRSVVATLWPVDDASSAALMGRFYQKLASGATAGEALREAKLEVSGRHPFHWAAFVLSGDAGTRIPRVVPLSWVLGAVVGLAGALLLFRR